MIVYSFLNAGAPQGVTLPPSDQVSLLFHDGILQHSSQSASALIPQDHEVHYWADLRATLLPRFPEFPDLPDACETGTLEVRAVDDIGPRQAQIEWQRNLCWVTLTDEAPKTAPSERAELDALRFAAETSPHPTWIEDASNQLIWCNQAYRGIADRLSHPPSFSAADAGKTQRFVLSGTSQDWYRVDSINADARSIHHAQCINALVAAEEAQRNFVQTLTKTFAHLSTGLAIFDRNGQLALFNPALVDLTGLRVEFLSAKPTMLSFFDQLRENRHMPEPKNYRTWRDEISEVIAAATDGRYHETWSLESGQTFSVSGRPHPDGATAFLIEDISAEVTVTRNFRAELEQAHSLIDGMEDAMAVFSSSGVLSLSNSAYRRLWQVDPDATFVDMTISDCIKYWRSNDPGREWQRIEAFVLDHTNAPPFAFTFSSSGKYPCQCNVASLTSGSTLVRFSVPASNTPQTGKEGARSDR
ncbi:PAS-domain containing protein [Sulfitobacter sp. TSTF-M16]|uniref:PAS-domain containing protein n=2 Tax=Sulfitobacter aestuariivivens TaxID=2766981 RepID=A0A927D4X3_9RHOB|nr:PAS-domain containing protein [Sulfitobacter aestuariivivens]MBD3665208.1 PAS-domain containing protein [Sulfitobacter aestuariivivens]